MFCRSAGAPEDFTKLKIDKAILSADILLLAMLNQFGLNDSDDLISTICGHVALGFGRRQVNSHLHKTCSTGHCRAPILTMSQEEDSFPFHTYSTQS